MNPNLYDREITSEDITREEMQIEQEREWKYDEPEEEIFFNQ